MDPQFEQMRLRWYQDNNVMFNIIDNLKYRETVFMRKVSDDDTRRHVERCLKINKIEYFFKNAKRYHFFEGPYQLYASLGWYPDMPMFSFNRMDKRDEMNNFNSDYSWLMEKLDFMLDIDNEDLDVAWSTALRVKELFDEARVPYWIQWSGGKGFHIRVDYDDFGEKLRALSFDKLNEKLKLFAENLADIHRLDSIDLSIFDLRRIAKTPYSISYPNYLVVLPLSDEQFMKFRLKMVTLPYNLNITNSYRKRGTLKRAGNGFGALVEEYTKL